MIPNTGTQPATSVTITCGTDFSDGAERAASVAAALAKRSRATLHLVHVVDELGAELAFAEGQMSPYEALRQRLLSTVQRLRTAYAIDVEPEFFAGVAWEGLVEAAKRVKSELIVVAAIGQTTRHRWLLGSVAERVAQTANVPVLVVRDGVPLMEWATTGRPLQVLLGMDHGAAARAALTWVGRLREIGACDVRVVRIVMPSEEHTRLGIPPPVPLEGLRPNVDRLLRREVRRWIGRVPGEGTISHAVEANWGRPEGALVLQAQRLPTDLIVVGTNQRAGIARVWQGSVSRRVLHDATCDVVVVPVASQGIPTSPRLERVLTATDFSASADRGVALAFGLVPDRGVLHVAHVSEDAAVDERRIVERLNKLIPPDASAGQVVAVPEVVRGSEVGAALLQLASRRGVDAICLATHGRGAVQTALLGSVAQYLVRHAECPVVLFPPRAVS